MSNVAISKGTVIYTSVGPVEVMGAGNGMYTVRFVGGKRTHTMPCAEVQAELASGNAFIANPAAFAEHEAPASYRTREKRDADYLDAQQARS